MNHLGSKEYLKSLACPSCGSAKLLLTKERIFICQSCLTGYKMVGEVPDFRLEKSISFKKKLADKKKGLNAVLTMTLGENKNQSIDVKLGHCVILGRQVMQDQSDDKTFVGKLEAQTRFTHLDSSNHQMVARYLSKGIQRSPADKEALHQKQKKLLGEYVRDPDLLLKEPSVSRSHAVVFQNEKGLQVLDLVSKNGTYVNGCEVEASKLKDNDVISLGTASMRVRIY